ncbi:hypothetical protein [Kitasatospora sp. NPDC086791]|uniref:hypothetical protein n=1 Tax=Kitasatospora sp. NPDC086791 TaxID=3155178 RepID=UPI003438CA9B
MTDAYPPLTTARLADIRDRGERPSQFTARTIRDDYAAMLAEINRLARVIDELTTEIAEGVTSQTMLKGLTVQDGRVCLEIEPAREMLLILVASMRAMLDDAGAENYLTTEATFPPEVSLDIQDGQHPEDSYTLTVQRRHRPTAHDFRRRAEADRDAARVEADRLRAELAAARDRTLTEAAEMLRKAVVSPNETDGIYEASEILLAARNSKED